MCVPGIRSSDGKTDHAICIADGWIFDSNFEKALPLSEESLNLCSSSSEQATNFVTAIRIMNELFLLEPHPVAHDLLKHICHLPPAFQPIRQHRFKNCCPSNVKAVVMIAMNLPTFKSPVNLLMVVTPSGQMMHGNGL
jgi:hypothetical protein